MSGLERLSLYTDGAARGNPGPAAIGYAIYDSSGNLVEKDAKCIGRRTNNEAEYEALLWGIERARERKCGRLTVFLDSELVARQLTGEYRTKDSRMKLYAEKVRAHSRFFEGFEICHVPRSNRRIALVDEMVNEVLDMSARAASESKPRSDRK